MDATYTPSNIRYPQDFSLLNEAREKLLNFKLNGIRLSGPKLERPSKDNDHSKEIVYLDNVHLIEVERMFILSKSCNNLGLIKTKLEETTMTSIALSIFVTNLFKIQSRALLDAVWKLLFSGKSPLVIAVY